jgi:DUF4097 and DUF4098 domain-containing protein YvlB
MNKIMLVVCLATALLLAAQIGSAGERQQSFPAKKGETLQVEVGSGNVTVRGWEKETVQVTVRSMSEEQLKKVEMSQGGGKVLVEYRWEGRRQERIEFDISVPSSFTVDLRTGGGNLTLLAPLSGNLKGSTAGGNVTLGGLGGKMQIETAGGNIEAGEISGDLEARSAGGEIQITGASGEVQVSTAGGDVEIGNTGKRTRVSTAGGNISIGKIGGDVEASTAGGNIRAESGQGNISLRSAGGNVELRSARGRVLAETSAGDVKLLDVQGSVTARTSAGNIEATLDPSLKESSSLLTSAGDVILWINEKAHATITARSRTPFLAGEDEGENSIESDFPMTREPGSARRAEVQIILNGGGHRIQIETLIGSISIRKAK